MNNTVKRKHTKAKREKSPTALLLISYIKPTLISLGVAAVMLLVSAVIASSVKDPAKLLAPLAYTSLYVSAFVGGVISAKGDGSPFISSLITGIILLFVYGVMSAFGYSSAEIKLGIIPSVVLHALIPGAAVLGGFAETKRAEKKRTRRRH